MIPKSAKNLAPFPFNRFDRLHLFSEISQFAMSSSYIVAISGLFVGIVLTLQGLYILKQFSASNQIGHVVFLSIFREIGPVITALLFIGNIASATTSEIGVIRLSEQEDALVSLGISPFRTLYLPKFIAGLLTLPMLLIVFLAFSTTGSLLTATGFFGIDTGLFWISIRQHILLSDILSGLVKAVVFAVSTLLIALSFGKKAQISSKGIAQATTYSVVTASVFIFMLDVLLTSIFLKEIWQ